MSNFFLPCLNPTNDGVPRTIFPAKPPSPGHSSAFFRLIASIALAPHAHVVHRGVVFLGCRLGFDLGRHKELSVLTLQELVVTVPVAVGAFGGSHQRAPMPVNSPEQTKNK